MRTNGASGSLIVLLIITILLFFVFWLFVVKQYNPAWAGGVIILLGALTIGGTLWWMYRRDKEWFSEIKEEFTFFKSFAWTLLAASALVVVGIHFLLLQTFFPHGNPVSGEIVFASTFALYFSTIAIGFGIHSLYSKSAPITSVYSLIRLITRDLHSNQNHKGPVTVVYPAPNLGCYRTWVDNKQQFPTSSEYIAFETQLDWAIANKSVMFVMYCYPDKLVEELYNCYVPSALQEEPNRAALDENGIIKQCVSHARSIINKAKDMTVNENCDVREIIPERFPSHVVIIENISYVILSYGLPFYDSSDSKFKPVEAKRATLLAYRREDPVLAEMIRNHLKMVCDTGPNGAPPPAPSAPTIPVDPQA